MKNKSKERPARSAEEAQRIAGGMARATHGRARVFKNKRREASRKACRGKMGGDF